MEDLLKVPYSLSVIVAKAIVSLRAVGYSWAYLSRDKTGYWTLVSHLRAAIRTR